MSSQNLFILWLNIVTLLVLILSPRDSLQGKYDNCGQLFKYPGKLKASDEKCSDRTGILNVPILGGVHCANNGTGDCKAFAGQFEFTFNTRKGQYVDHAPQSEFVDSNGYHKRVPVAYDIKGDIFYHDRPINYAIQQTRKWREDGRKINLLDQTDFNWCYLVANNYWPYKSAIKDYHSKGRFHIYFSHRQSCIVDTQSGKRQHFNTRFQHNTTYRVDLDANPLIFAMEDHLANEVRLVKNKRQHWYEQGYRVLEKPSRSVNFFLKIDNDEKKPCIVNGTGPLLSKSYYANKGNNFCLNDDRGRRATADTKNSNLMEPKCGLDEVELADYTWLNYLLRNRTGPRIHEADLHNLPRFPKESELFFGIYIENNDDWETWAKDGFTFTAVTSIPIELQGGKGYDPDSVRVIMLYSGYKRRQASSVYDEHYPTTLMSDYTAKRAGEDWTFDRESKAKEIKNLNYVDDIAYLHKCKTILVIFGPFYQELPKDQFNLNYKGPAGSIVDLGAHEAVNAFFAVPEEDTIWLYHRTNFVQQIQYTCGNGKDKLVTGKRIGNYLDHSGSEMGPFWNSFQETMNLKAYSYSFHEESLFKEIGLFTGEVSRAPPDPRNYPLGKEEAPLPEEERDNTLVYVLVGVGILLILIMLLLSFIVVRRRLRKHRHNRMAAMTTARSSALGSGASSMRTNRSGMSSAGPASGPPTARSSLRSASNASRTSGAGGSTTRSSLRSATSGASRATAGTPTARSRLHSRASGASGASGSSRSSAPLPSTVRSRQVSASRSPSGSMTSNSSAASRHSNASQRHK